MWPGTLHGCQNVTIGERKLVGGSDLDEIVNGLLSWTVFVDLRYTSGTLSCAMLDSYGPAAMDAPKSVIQHESGSVSRKEKS